MTSCAFTNTRWPILLVDRSDPELQQLKINKEQCCFVCTHKCKNLIVFDMNLEVSVQGTEAESGHHVSLSRFTFMFAFHVPILRSHFLLLIHVSYSLSKFICQHYFVLH